MPKPTEFLLYYTNCYEAAENGLPKAGTTVEIETLADLDALSKRLGEQDLIIHSNHDDGPTWADYFDTFDEDDREFHHCVDALPEGWENMRWLEVYNGYRE